ncbi:MAG TPA: SBBP repeat-containing protein [candidate division Zixibacteria bacterium]|nr:SBBP repeat-containing protein [candidate division Zixibacteria bacterium]
MSFKIFSLVFGISVIGTIIQASSNPEGGRYPKSEFSTMPLAFTENQGQWPDSILYRSSADGATMWYTPTGVYYQFAGKAPKSDDRLSPLPMQDIVCRPGKVPDFVKISMIKAQFVGANESPCVLGEYEMEYKCNYFIGNDSSKWRTDVPNYESIQYKEVYPGIDMKYYGNGKQLEYDFIVSPGANFSQIQIRYFDADTLCIAENGDLKIKTNFGEITELQPKIHQIIDGRKVSIKGNYVLMSKNSFGFELESQYNPELALVIDPLLVYSTYLGGSGDDDAWGLAVDDSGAAYVVGHTLSTDFPTLNPNQPDQASHDAFVTKLARNGNSLVYSTYLGGSSDDFGKDITVDGDGSVFVTGYTTSSDFPTQNPFQNTHQQIEDVFVTKLSSSGDSLVYSTYLGGNNSDYGYGVAIDDSGSVFVTGSTESTDFPTLNPFQDTHQTGGTYDAFVSKLSIAGSSLVYSTYLGGTNDEGADGGIAIDSTGAAYITGLTASSDFPTVNPFQGTYQGGIWDAFVSKLSSAGDSLEYSTYLGGNERDEGRGIVVDESGNAFVAGLTISSNFPVLNPFQAIQGSVDSLDAFVTKLSSDGNNLIYSTYLGGSGSDYCDGIAFHSSGTAYVTGVTTSVNFPTLDPNQGTLQGTDAFVTKLSESGNGLLFSTYLGGSNLDYIFGDIAVDAFGTAYVTGHTYSIDFPTLNQFQTNQDFADAFVTKFACCIGIRGDVNNDGQVNPNILDLNYLVNRIFRGGPTAVCLTEADCNNDNTPQNIVDLNFLVNYIFRGGAAPGAC